MIWLCFEQIHSWRRWEDEARIDRHDALSGQFSTIAFNVSPFKRFKARRMFWNWILKALALERLAFIFFFKSNQEVTVCLSLRNHKRVYAEKTINIHKVPCIKSFGPEQLLDMGGMHIIQLYFSLQKLHNAEQLSADRESLIICMFASLCSWDLSWLWQCGFTSNFRLVFSANLGGQWSALTT